MPIYREYFEDHGNENDKEPLNKKDTEQRAFIGAQESFEYKFYFFVPININKYIK